ncbi:MAG: ubiquitin carboxyl-terminal hydrolase [Rhabdochlamydiaceae bacterium]|nr:ubiquitin carboxyl-terminal hydrolase [Rhabdochlamydiaceae bacterium]
MSAFSVTRDQKIFDLMDAKYDVYDSLTVQLMLSEDEQGSERITKIYNKYLVAHTDLKFFLHLCEGESGNKKKIREKITRLKEFHSEFKRSCGFLQTIDFNNLTKSYIRDLKVNYDAYKVRFKALEAAVTEKNLSRYVRAYAALKMSFPPLLLSVEPSSKKYRLVEHVKGNIQQLHKRMQKEIGLQLGDLIGSGSVSTSRRHLMPPSAVLPEAQEQTGSDDASTSAPEHIETRGTSLVTDTRPPVGLRNPSDHCWVISALQVLIHSSPRLLEQAAVNVPRLHRILNSYRQAQEQGLSNVKKSVTIPLRKDLKKLSNGDVRTSGQDDAANFFHACFQGGNALYRFNREVVVSGGLKGEKYAYTSSTKNADAKAMIDLELNVREGKKRRKRDLSFEESLARFFRRDAPDYRNEQTGKKTGAVVQLKFSQAPDELVFHVKRFTHHIKYGLCVSVVNHDPFDLPSELTLDPGLVDEPAGAPLDYQCNAFCVQEGSLGGGHYIAYVLKEEGKNKQWYCCDDRWTYPVSTKKALKEMRLGYIYSYSKKS